MTRTSGVWRGRLAVSLVSSRGLHRSSDGPPGIGCVLPKTSLERRTCAGLFRLHRVQWPTPGLLADCPVRGPASLLPQAAHDQAALARYVPQAPGNRSHAVVACLHALHMPPVVPAHIRGSSLRNESVAPRSPPEDLPLAASVSPGYDRSELPSAQAHHLE